jgi:predicted nucleic acid-binding protein
MDALLAAAAEVQGLTLVTRNIKDIQRSGARCLNPFEFVE